MGLLHNYLIINQSFKLVCQFAMTAQKEDLLKLVLTTLLKHDLSVCEAPDSVFKLDKRLRRCKSPQLFI